MYTNNLLPLLRWGIPFIILSIMKHAEIGVALFHMVLYSRCSGMVNYWPYPIGLILWMGQCHMIVTLVNLMLGQISRSDGEVDDPFASEPSDDNEFRDVAHVLMKMIKLIHPVSFL